MAVPIIYLLQSASQACLRFPQLPAFVSSALLLPSDRRLGLDVAVGDGAADIGGFRLALALDGCGRGGAWAAGWGGG